MTFFPSVPKFDNPQIIGGVEYRSLSEDHVTYVPIMFGWSLEVVIKAGFKTDGATVSISNALLKDSKFCKKIRKLVKKYFPEEEFDSIYRRLVGTPWDIPRLLAAVVHDALYSLKWKCRWLCDNVYRFVLIAAGYDPIRREIEYDAIRLVGWRHLNAVTKEERKEAKNLVFVRLVKTKDIPSLIGKVEEIKGRNLK